MSGLQFATVSLGVLDATFAGTVKVILDSSSAATVTPVYADISGSPSVNTDRVLVEVVAGKLLLVNNITRAPALGVVAFAASAAAATATGTTEIKDSGTADVAFYAQTGRFYRLNYMCLASANGTAEFLGHIRDGGASSPTNASAAVAGSRAEINPGALNAFADFRLEQVEGFTAGMHTIAFFYAKSSGGTATTVTPVVDIGMLRELWVEDLGML